MRSQLHRRQHRIQLTSAPTSSPNPMAPYKKIAPLAAQSNWLQATVSRVSIFLLEGQTRTSMWPKCCQWGQGAPMIPDIRLRPHA